MKIKNIENTYEKKMNIVKQELAQSLEKENGLRVQMDEIVVEMNNKIKSLEEYHVSKEQQLNLLVTKKENEYDDLVLVYTEAKEKISELHHENQALKTHKQELYKNEEHLKTKMNELIDEHLKEIAILQASETNMNYIIATMLEKYQAYQKDER